MSGVHAPDRGLSHGLWITLGFGVVEACAGWWSGSLALLSDSGHMLTDAAALGLAALAERHAHGKPHAEAHRVEVTAACINALMMFVVIALIVYESIERLREPEPVKGGVVFAVAFLGLLVNGWVAWILSRGHVGLNRRAALLHVLSDMLGSIAALAAGLIIILTGWLPVDPLLSMLVAGLIAYGTINLLRDLGASDSGHGHSHGHKH